MCDTVVVVQPGRVLFAKNSDRDPNEAQSLEWVPAAVHAPGTTVRCTWIEIPQAPRTHAILISRPFWMWGAEIGANEHGVTIGNEAVFTRQPYAKIGLTGMDLLRLALERSTTARQACDCIQSLIADFGQGGGCGHENRNFTYHNSFLIADPSQAMVLETAGAFCAVEQVQGARSISNGLTIPGFAETHLDSVRSRVSECRVRQSLTQNLAIEARGPADLASLLANHGAGRDEPRYSLATGGMDAPCMHAGGLLASAQTTASWISELRPEVCRHWATATSAPCTGVFKPVQVELPVAMGPFPTDKADESSLWWRHERLHRLTMRNPRLVRRLFAEERDELQQRCFRHPIASHEAFRSADEKLRIWTNRALEANPSDRRQWWVRRYWNARNHRAGLDFCQ